MAVCVPIIIVAVCVVPAVTIVAVCVAASVTIVAVWLFPLALNVSVWGSLAVFIFMVVVVTLIEQLDVFSEALTLAITSTSDAEGTYVIVLSAPALA